MNKGRLIVLSAPSGCGKGTILEKVLEDDNFYLSVSATTRDPRSGEIDGVNYHFITKEDFESRIASDGMLEYAEYCGNYYGTPQKEINEQLEAGKDVILEIEVQGALKVMELRPDALFVFVIPPSIEELRRRLRKRGTESEEVIEERVNRAVEEIKYAHKYDYIIVNNVLEDAVNDFRTVVKAEKLRRAYADELLDEVIKNA